MEDVPDAPPAAAAPPASPPAEPAPPQAAEGPISDCAAFNPDGWECELCSDFGHGPITNSGPVCPYRKLFIKMEKMEALMDERMKFLDELLALPCNPQN